MKRVVTGINQHGMSCVISNEEVAQGILWEFQPDQLRGWIEAIAPEEAAVHMEPPVAGGSTWAQASIQPGTAVKGMSGVDDRGFHTTRTVDFVYLVDGELTLVLEEGTVDLHKGDCVVQQATRHAWSNGSAEPATILVLMHKPGL